MTNQKVGSVYAAALDGIGLMLAASPQRPVRRQTGVLDTQPPGSDDPLSERVGRYDFIGASDWTGGEGQEMLDRPLSDVTRYFYSEGLDPFTTPGQVTCLPAMKNFNADTLSLARVVSVSDTDIYVRTGLTSLTHLDGLPDSGTPTEFTAVGGADLQGLTTDGAYWYACDAAGIRRNNTAANPGSDWSDVNAVDIAWIGDRIAALDVGVGTTASFTTLDPDGDEENVGGWVQHPGATLNGICGGGGYAWWGVRSSSASDTAHVHYWQVDSDPINHGIALVLPPGERVGRLFFYLGNVFLVTYAFFDPAIAKVYRCVSNGDGLLTPSVVQEMELPGDPGFDFNLVGGMAGVGKYVAFGWTGMQRTGENGIGVIDLETGGVARWHATASTDVDEAVFVARHRDDFILTAGSTGGGLFGPDDSGDFRNGFLESSTSDLATPAQKHLDEIQVSTLPLPTSSGAASVAVAYSIDDGANYTTLDTYNTAGETRHSTELATAVVTHSLRTRLTLTTTGDASDKPTVTAALAKTHVTGITDEIIELPVNCDDYITDVKGHPIAEDSGHDKGAARYRSLQALIGSKVMFQDTDWKTTGTETLVEVIGVESSSALVFNPRTNRNDIAQHVAVVTLRRPYEATVAS